MKLKILFLSIFIMLSTFSFCEDSMKYPYDLRHLLIEFSDEHKTVRIMTNECGDYNFEYSGIIELVANDYILFNDNSYGRIVFTIQNIVSIR